MADVWCCLMASCAERAPLLIVTRLYFIIFRTNSLYFYGTLARHRDLIILTFGKSAYHMTS